MNLFHNILFITGLLLALNVAAESSKWQAVESIDGAETIKLEQAKALYAKGVLFIDVRSIRQYSKRHIKGAINLYVNDTFTQQNLQKQVQKDEPFVVYCNGAHCSLSSKATRMAIAWGYTQVKYFRTGMRDWRLNGNPIETGSPH